MTTSNESLFRGEFLRFTAAYPGDAEQMARFSEDFDYLRRLDSDFAVPQQPSAFAASNTRGTNNVEFMLRPQAKTRFHLFSPWATATRMQLNSVCLPTTPLL